MVPVRALGTRQLLVTPSRGDAAGEGRRLSRVPTLVPGPSVKGDRAVTAHTGSALRGAPRARRALPLHTGCTRVPAGGLRPRRSLLNGARAARGALRVRGRAAGAGPAATLEGEGGALPGGPRARAGACLPFARAEGTRAAPALLPLRRPLTRCSGFEHQVGTLVVPTRGLRGGGALPTGTRVAAPPASRLQVSRQRQGLWPWPCPGRSSAG